MNVIKALSLSVALILCAQISSAGEFLVKYKNSNMLNKMAALQTESSGMQMQSINRKASYVKVYINKANEIRTLAALYSDKDVAYVVPNFKLHSFSNPVNITSLKEQYALTKINAEQAWKRAGNKGKKNILLAVIDTGADYKHESLAPNMVAGFDFKDNDADPMDETSSQNPGHGTHCSGIIGATGLVDGGVQGISPEVSVMPLRFLGSDGSGDLDSAIKAIDYAIDKKVSVISASWGASVPLSTAQPLVEAIERADKAGVIFVTAASNDGKNNDTTDVYPANAGTENMLSIAASNSSDTKPSWSNYGKAKVSIAAPGDAIISSLPGNKYANLSGTSMATPLVAGLVAFLRAQDSSLSGAEIRSLMQTTGAKVQIDTACNCRIDALAAVDTLLSKKAWIVPAAATIAEKATLQMRMKNASGSVKFESSNPAVASIDESGLLTALAAGTVTVKATDSTGASATSLDVNIGAVSSSPGNPGNPGTPTPGECPLGDASMCEIFCQIMPTMPWCTK